MKKKAEHEVDEYSGVSRHIETKVALLEQALDYMNHALETIAKHVDKTNDKLDKIDSKINSRFFWILSLNIASFTALLGVLARGFHWI